jgi:GAF domain-containing protein
MEERFPFRRVLSFEALIERWREVADGGGRAAAVAADVIAAVEAVPELRGTIDDASVVERHADLVELLMSAVFPMAAGEAGIGAAMPPFDPTPFYLTPGARRTGLMEAMRGDLGKPTMEFRALLVYQYILSVHYGVAFEVVVPFDVTGLDPESGLERHFRVTVDTRFARAVPVGELPVLEPERIEALLADRLNFDLWQEALPAGSFELRGFAIMQFTDVTEQRVIAALTSDLLRPDAMATPRHIDRLRDRLRTLLRRADIELGLICVERDDEDAITGAVPIGRSILLSDGTVPHCPNKAASFYTKVVESRAPWVVRDLSRIEIPSRFEAHVLNQGIRNILVAPLEIGDRLIGLIELASPEPGALHLFNTGHIREVLGLFAIAMERMVDDRENRIQAVIKQKYTAIHPAVEWRFRKAAQNYIEASRSGEYVRPEPIVFGDVHPLYGLSDVRGSSTHRAAAIQADLVEQLELARDVVAAAARARPLPVLAELDHRIETFARGVTEGLRSGDEVRVLDFLGAEFADVMRQVEGFGAETAAAVARYRVALDPDLGFLYRSRRDFEEAVTRINDTISAFIDREQARAQEMFPHYFERFKTDGVDYNIYVGASLQEDGRFDPIFLRNLRLWQLMVMCSIVRELRGIEDTLPVPLEVAHLVLVHSSPLAIRFRADEKRFDVDGAYNIRYEIVKKRIDKARIRHTREQLTQPGRIAIVYSHPREATEYREYFEFLRANGFIDGGIEDLELEDLQGASGLQALRVTVAADREPAREIAGASNVLELTNRFARLAD